MTKDKLSYLQTRQFIIHKMKGVNISKFCTAYNISYQQYQNFKSYPTKQYPSVAKQILKGLGFKVVKIEKITLFHIQEKKNYKMKNLDEK